MTTLFLGLNDGLLRLDVNGSAKAEWALKGPLTFSVSIDPVDPKYVIATSVGGGVFRSEDGGRSFEPAGEGIPPLVFASSISATERTKDGGVVYAGTMPSAMYRSEDGGRTFRELEEFAKMPGLEEAAFPATPATHMIHMIATSFNRDSTVMAGIELGGVIKSDDGGETWTRTDGGPDCHQLLFHPSAPDRVYESDGAGPVESRDNGETWKLDYEGIPEEIDYFYDMAVDPGDPDNRFVSAGPNQYQAHGLDPYAYKVEAFDRNRVLDGTYSTIYRKQGDAPWEAVTEGLPDSHGHDQGRFATAAGDDTGTLYYLTIPGDLYRTTDGGDSWSQIEIEYPSDANQRMLHVARAVKD